MSDARMPAFDTDMKQTCGWLHSINSFRQIDIGVNVAVPCLGYIKYNNMFKTKNLYNCN